jgi:hypothetical protein
MKGVFKRNRQEPIPAGATIERRPVKLKTRETIAAYAVWTDAAGKRREAPLNRTEDMIVIPPQKDDPYYIVYTDRQTGKRVTIKWGLDKTSADEKRRELERGSERRAIGIENKATETATTPVLDVVGEWGACLRSKRAPQQIIHVTRIIEWAKFTRAHEIEEPRVLKALGERRTLAEAGEIRFSETTESEYRQSI